MTDYTWNGIVSTDASVAGNWTPSGVPTTGDKAIFDVSGGTQPCTFNITALDEIEIKSDNLSIITFTADVSLAGLSVSAAGTMAATAPIGITFSGTPLYKSGLCYIEIGTASSPFNNTVSRGHFTFTSNPSTGNLYFDTGIYPHVKLGGNGNKTPQYVAPTVANSTDVHFLTLRISTGTFAPASATPTDNDKAKSFIIDSSSSQFIIDASGITSFNGGYATWTFQAASSGFLIPTSNLTEYQGCDFTFQKMSIVATSDGAGAWAKIAANGRLYLTDFTIGVGASVKGAGASAIHLINRPTIKGTWGFFPIADGIYHHKDGEVLGVANGGTGLANVNQYYIPFGTDGNTLTTSANFTFDNSSNELTIDGKLTVTGLIDPTGLELTPVASNPGGIAANTLWLNSGDSNKLYHGSSEIAGGGGATVDTASVTAAGALMDSEVTNLAQVKAFDSADYATAAQGALADTSLQDPAAFATAAQGAKADSAQQPPSEGAFANGDKTKLDGIAAGATATPALQHFRLRMKSNSNAVNYTVTGSYTVLDLANTSIWEETTTGAHADIVLVNDTNDHITLSAGGIYQIVVSVEFFPTSSQLRDMWLVISTDASSTGQLGTDRLQSLSTSAVGNVQLKHSVVYEIPNAGSDTDIYFSLRSNGNNSNIIAFNSGSNRTSITVTRIGDAIS